ncbi:hypothetical protein QEL93_002437 [Pseudomonas putida]|nr:hypothetical protein [Pseudomonas putida]
MTNVVVWKVSGLEEIRVAADSRVSRGNSDVKRVTDQAAKIFPLKLQVHGNSDVSITAAPVLTVNLGFAYAGAVVPALMTYAAATQMLGNLYPEKPRLPRLSDAARLICHLSQQYTRDASLAYQTNSPPFCEFVIFGHDAAALDDPGAANLAYWIHPQLDPATGMFHQVMKQFDLDKGEVVVIGDDSEALQKEIAALPRGTSRDGLEPKVALENRMLKQGHETVGGTLQFGLLTKNEFRLYGALYDSMGNFQQNWLGFDCQNEISQIVGMPVCIPALP